MADTRKTLSDLQALLANNTTGNISAQDLRDFLVSCAPAFGSIYVTTAADTTIAVAGTFYKAAGTTAAVNLSDFDMPTNNRLRYTGAADIHVRVTASITMTATSSNVDISFRLVKNATPGGTDAVSSEVDRKVGTGADRGALSIQMDTTMSNGDYIELWVTNQTSATNVKVEHMNMFVQGLLV